MTTLASPQAALLEIKRDGQGKIWSCLRNKWLVETPEETVRQNFLPVLVNEYGYALEQMDEELDKHGAVATETLAPADDALKVSVGLEKL